MLRIEFKVKDAGFWLAFILGISTIVISNIDYNMSAILSLFKLAMTAALISGVLIRGRFRPYALAMSGIFLALCVMAYYYNKLDVIVYNLLFLLLADSIKIRDIIKVYFVTILVITCMTIVLALAGIFPLTMIAKGRVLYKFGFVTANTFAAMILRLMLAYICIRYEKLNLVDYVGMLLLAAGISEFAASRTAAFLFVIAFAALLYSKVIRKAFESKVFLILVTSMPAFLFGVSWLITGWYIQGDGKSVLINNVLSNRLYYWSYYASNYSIMLFGNKLYTVSSYMASQLNIGWMGLDSSYMYLMLGGGLVTFFVISLLNYCSMKNAVLCKEKGLIIAILVFLIYGFTENGWYNCWYNFTLFAAVPLLHKKFKDVIKEECRPWSI